MRIAIHRNPTSLVNSVSYCRERRLKVIAACS